MIKLNEITAPLKAIENDLNCETIPRRQAERRKQSPQPHTLSSGNSSAHTTSLVERRKQERRKSRPKFLSFEELITLRKK